MSNDFTRRSDQWDIRLNITTTSYLDRLLGVCDLYCRNGSVKYLHVSGVEIGTNPAYDSYGNSHVHIALVLHNPTSKRAIVNRFTDPENGWYVEPRDKTKSLHGWLEYHKKVQTKVNSESLTLYEFGVLPMVRQKREVDEMTPSEIAKKQKKIDDWKRKKYLMTSQAWDALDEEFPGFIYSSMGQSMKREVMKQSNDEYNKPLEGKLNNYIIWGGSGTGKSSSVALLYPNCYKKQKGSQYWDAYDKTNPDHSIVWIDEMSQETLKTMTGKQDGGFEFLKELADRYPVTVDEKYTKGYKIRPKSIIITMNEHPTSLLPARAIEVNKQALFRKFKVLHVEEWLFLNGLRNTKNGCEFIPISEFAAQDKELENVVTSIPRDSNVQAINNSISTSENQNETRQGEINGGYVDFAHGHDRTGNCRVA